MDERMIGIGGIVIGAAGLFFAAIAHKKMTKIGDTVDRAVSELADSTNVEIREAIIEQAVQQAVNREVHYAVKLSANAAVQNVTDEMGKEIRTCVKNAYTDMRAAVSKEMFRQIQDIDISSVKNEVIDKAKDAAMEKLNTNMDSILEKFNANLQNVSNIYNSIASSMTANSNGKEMTFKIS